ncbi:hypothetical protein FXB39_17250 [Nocardioides sp. BGMRC 2183]|nr:hypothetical protein FXB39_17250 [Nocardioides sp. BGMRC 2183]
MSPAEARAKLDAIAPDTGLTDEELAARLTERARQAPSTIGLRARLQSDMRQRPAHAGTVGPVNRLRSRQRDDVDTAAAPGDGEDWVKMPKGKYPGDFFYYPSSTLGINHGHVGLFRRSRLVVEAANKKTGVRKIRTSKRRVPDNETFYFWIHASGQTDEEDFVDQLAAAKWGRARVGADYRPWWMSTNKSLKAPFNCSQLIWAAYKKRGINLDNNGGDHVFPVNIVQDSETTPYKQV